MKQSSHKNIEKISVACQASSSIVKNSFTIVTCQALHKYLKILLNMLSSIYIDANSSENLTSVLSGNHSHCIGATTQRLSKTPGQKMYYPYLSDSYEHDAQSVSQLVLESKHVLSDMDLNWKRYLRVGQLLVSKNWYWLTSPLSSVDKLIELDGGDQQD